MSEQSNSARPEGHESGESGVGRTLRETRQAANIDVNKICTDLRIAPQALEALESGNYHLLPGDPYIRALLGSIGRYLSLDPLLLIQLYNKEIGAMPAAPVIAPYKDRAQTYSTSHKQIFIGIFVALFVLLFLLIGKLNKGEGEPFSFLPGPADSAVAANPLSVPQDTSLESQYLAPDSSAAPAGPATATAPASGTAAPAAMPPAPVDTAPLISAVVKPLIDSVGVKVLRYGKEDFATILRLGKQMQVSHTDTITIFISKARSVEVILGERTVIPERRRFKIFGNNIKTF